MARTMPETSFAILRKNVLNKICEKYGELKNAEKCLKSGDAQGLPKIPALRL